MNSYDNKGKIPAYHETDDEVLETAESAIKYIFEGDLLHQIYDLRGLCVFGVVAALRLYDEAFYGDESTLTPEQLARVREVEDAVQEAVEKNMHYYPFGDSQNKSKVEERTHAQLSGSKKTQPVGNTRIKSPADRKYLRRIATERAQVPEPSKVTVRKLED